MKQKQLYFILISLLLCLVCTCLVACDNNPDSDKDPSTLPANAVQITKDNLEDWFDIHTDYEHAADSYSMVTLKASFVPKYELYRSTVVVNYSHNAMWDTYNKFLIVSGAVTLTLKAGNVTAHTENGAYSGKEYDVKAGTNTITINSVEGYIIKSTTQAQKPSYSEENGDELRERLSAFQSAFNSADIVSLTSNSHESIVSVFSDIAIKI